MPQRLGLLDDPVAGERRGAVEEALAPMVSEVLREQPRITVGHARVLGNSLVRPERLTARLVTDAGANARNLRERKAHRDRTTLQDVILGEGLTTVYQPIEEMGFVAASFLFAPDHESAGRPSGLIIK